VDWEESRHARPGSGGDEPPALSDRFQCSGVSFRIWSTVPAVTAW
jgi:hypothetical protein